MRHMSTSSGDKSAKREVLNPSQSPQFLPLSAHDSRTRTAAPVQQQEEGSEEGSEGGRAGGRAGGREGRCQKERKAQAG